MRFSSVVLISLFASALARIPEAVPVYANDNAAIYAEAQYAPAKQNAYDGGQGGDAFFDGGGRDGDQYREVHYESLGEGLANSMWGALVGMLLIPLSVVCLCCNERRFVKSRAAFDRVKHEARTLGSGDSATEDGSIVFVVGQARGDPGVERELGNQVGRRRVVNVADELRSSPWFRLPSFVAPPKDDVTKSIDSFVVSEANGGTLLEVQNAIPPGALRLRRAVEFYVWQETSKRSEQKQCVNE